MLELPDPSLTRTHRAAVAAVEAQQAHLLALLARLDDCRSALRDCERGDEAAVQEFASRVLNSQRLGILSLFKKAPRRLDKGTLLAALSAVEGEIAKAEAALRTATAEEREASEAVNVSVAVRTRAKLMEKLGALGGTMVELQGLESRLSADARTSLPMLLCPPGTGALFAAIAESELWSARQPQDANRSRAIYDRHTAA